MFSSFSLFRANYLKVLCFQMVEGLTLSIYRKSLSKTSGKKLLQNNLLRAAINWASRAAFLRQDQRVVFLFALLLCLKSGYTLRMGFHPLLSGSLNITLLLSVKSYKTDESAIIALNITLLLSVSGFLPEFYGA